MLNELGEAAKELHSELYASLIRARTDPIGVRAEAMAVEKLCLRLSTRLQEAWE